MSIHSTQGRRGPPASAKLATSPTVAFRQADHDGSHKFHGNSSQPERWPSSFGRAPARHGRDQGYFSRTYVPGASSNGGCFALPIRGGAPCRTRARRKPRRPIRPPAALVARRTLQPLLGGGGRRITGLFGPVGAFATGRIDDPCDMTAGGTHEPHVTAKQLCDAPGGVPGHDVVLLRPDRIGVLANAAEIDHLVLERDLPGSIRLFST